jgi:hypothetical protein
MTGIERGLELEQAAIRANGHTLTNLPPSCAGSLLHRYGERYRSRTGLTYGYE